MAIANSDGSIILSTKVDTSGIIKGMNQAKSKADGLTKTFSKLGSAIASAFAVQKIIQFGNESSKVSSQTEASVQRLIDIYGSASDSVGNFIDANARALGMSKAAAASFSSVYGNLFSVWADQETNAKLTNEYLQMTAVVASKTGRTVEDVQERVRSGLLGNTEAIEDLGIFVNVKTIEMTDAFQRMANGKSWEQLDAYTQQQIRSMAILEQATSKYGNEVSKTSAFSRQQLKAAYDEFKNTFGQIVNIVLIPVLNTFTKIIEVATSSLNLISGRSGKLLEGTSSVEENIDKSSQNQQKLTENVKKTNKELKKTLAGFDDIQILTGNAAESTEIDEVASPSAILGNFSSGGQETSSDFEPMNYANKIKDALEYLLPIIELSLVAIGLLIISTGNIPLGIGFMAAGAYLYSVSERSSGSFDLSVIKSDLQFLLEYIGEALIAIGVILLFFGNLPLGIGFIIAGAVIYGVKEVSTGEYGGLDIQTKLAVIMEYVSAGLVAIGVILIMFGHIPLGIGFLFVGYKMLDITEKQLNEGGATTKIQRFFEENQKIFVGVGLALIVLGVLLLLTPISFPIALGLIAAGASSLAVEQQINGTKIIDDIRSFLFENPLLISLISGGLLVLGIILCVTGVMLPLGIGLIAAGAAGLVAEVALNWDSVVDFVSAAFERVMNWVSVYGGLILGIILLFSGVGAPFGLALIMDSISSISKGEKPALWDSILENIKRTWNNIKSYWNANIANVWTLKFWLDLAKIAGNGLISGFENAINGIIGMFEKMINWIVNGLNKISFDIPDWLGGGSFGINIPNVSFGRVSIPRLAQGAVIPPNREFLAVLGDQKQGTNIEAPLQTIVDAFNIALSQNGGYNGGNTEVILEIDGREFGRAVVEQGNRENRRIGTRLVIA